MQTVKFYRRNVYGRDLLYIADPKQKAAIQTLTDKTTVDRADIAALATLGVTFTEIIPPANK